MKVEFLPPPPPFHWILSCIQFCIVNVDEAFPGGLSSSYLNLRALQTCCLGKWQSRLSLQSNGGTQRSPKRFSIYINTWKCFPISYVENLNQLQSYLAILCKTFKLGWMFSGLSSWRFLLPIFSLNIYLMFTFFFIIFLPKENWSSDDMFTHLVSYSHMHYSMPSSVR